MVLSQVRSLEELLVVASLPESAIQWLTAPLKIGDIRVTTSRKSRGGYREVHEPLDESLLRLHKRLKEFLDRDVIDAHASVHGFTRGRGTYSNALVHLGAPAVLTVDISEFFKSISRQRVESALESKGATTEISAAIANVCTFGGYLATGFSTSPVLSNLVFGPVDILLGSYASELGLLYTRYADDLTFSGDAVGDENLSGITNILSEQNFTVNRKKVRFQRKGRPQVVTGYVVAHSDHPRLSKNTKKVLRQDLYFSRQIGLAAQARFRGLDPDVFRERLLGRISYLMGAERPLALKMRADFEQTLEAEAAQE